jgi:glycosyltransferase involved in cell wall biosynthesis
MKSSRPKISILMPSYNQGRYLEAAIRSVVTQDYPDKELILIDGGSSDNSVEIIKRYQADLTYSVSEPDRGQAHALNKGLSHITGEIIGWLNSDDCYLPGAFSRVARAFEKNPDAVLVHGDRIMIDGNGHVSGWSALPDFNPETTGFTVCSETAFWRNLRENNLRFNEQLRFAMDLDFFCRLYRTGRFVMLPSYLGAFRCHADSKSATIPELGAAESEVIWKEIFPEAPDGWKNTPAAGKFRLLLRLLQHPFTIALPYCYRRFVLGLRGTETRRP